MPKCAPIAVRFDPAVKLALERAAKADQRSVSSLVSKIVAAWLEREQKQAVGPVRREVVR
jgi:predicted transcriptional regulator